MPEFQKLPDPWLYDTDALIADLDSVRELILRIPVHNNTVLPTNAAIAPFGIYASESANWPC